jgi:SAM-dependent methyltransferase
MASLSEKWLPKYLHRRLFDISKRGLNTRSNPAAWSQPFETLRKKWHEVPGVGTVRHSTKQLLDMTDKELLDFWRRTVADDTTGLRFNVRGWYHTLYKDVLKGKRVMDVGSGLGIDGLTFAQNGAHMTFVDIVESNLTILKRLCGLLGLKDVTFCYMKDLDSLSALPADYDVIWCQGSLINAPFDVTKGEVRELLKHLPMGGRWIELAYPKTYWIRDGKLPFNKWGAYTDGGAPWIEWYDLEKLQKLLEPALFDVILYFEFHDNNFNWFDLVRRA